MNVHPTLVLAAVLLGGGSADAQSMRPFTTFRQMHGETRLTAKLDYAAGNLRLAAGRPSELYRMDLSYDDSRFLPLSDFDASRGAVLLGLKTAGAGGLRVVSQNQLRQVAAVAFSPRVDLELELNLGAVDGEVEMGGLRVSSLDLKAGASRSVVRFSKPNGIRCRHASFSAGAAELIVRGLGNSRCDDIAFEGGMGKVTLDFTGAWASNARVQVQMAMGELTLRLPRRIGVRITMDRFLSSFETAGLVRRNNGFQSANYDPNQGRIDIDLSTAMGGVTVQWIE
jgi:hypothetical protein